MLIEIGSGSLALERALGEQAHVVGRDDIDAGEALFLDDEAVDAAVHAEFGIARDHHARRDHRPAVIDRRHRDRYFVEIDVVADERDFAGRRGFHVLRRNRLVDRGLELVLDFSVRIAAERHGGALARADDAGHERHVVADDAMEEQRRLGLVHQGGDVPDIHRLMDIDQFAGLAQAIEKLTEIFLHQGLQRATRRVVLRLLDQSGDEERGRGRGGRADSVAIGLSPRHRRQMRFRPTRRRDCARRSSPGDPRASRSRTPCGAPVCPAGFRPGSSAQSRRKWARTSCASPPLLIPQTVSSAG